MNNLEHLNAFALDIQVNFEYATECLVTADSTLLSKIKAILITLGLYKPDADSAARKLIPILTSATFAQDYEELNSDQKSLINSAVSTVYEHASEKVQHSLDSIDAVKNLLILTAQEGVTAQLARDRQMIEEAKNKSALAKAKKVRTTNFADNQVKNMNKLLEEIRDNCPDRLYNVLVGFRSENGETTNKFEKLIDELKAQEESDLLNNVLNGEITEDELINGKKSLATIISNRSQIK